MKKIEKISEQDEVTTNRFNPPVANIKSSGELRVWFGGYLYDLIEYWEKPNAINQVGE